MKKTPLLLICFILSGFAGFLQAQPAAFDISGTIKTVEKKDDREMELPRGDVEIKEDAKILEIHLRRTNPTVSGEVTVRWVVLIKDVRGYLRPVTTGKQNIVAEVGIPATLESDAFSLQTANFDFGRRNDGKIEQEVEGYGIVLLNAAGEEVGSKFQPKSIEDKVREKIVDPAPAEEPKNQKDSRKPNRRNRPEL